jgi:hypothetical protein
VADSVSDLFSGARQKGKEKLRAGTGNGIV